MKRNRLAATGAALIVMTMACRAESPQRTTEAPRETPPPRVAAPSAKSAEAARPVRPSPEVVALLEPDPDLDTVPSPEEVKATLEAARNRNGTRAAPSADTGSPGKAPAEARSSDGSPSSAAEEWAKLEEAKKKKIEKWRERLAATTVYVGNDIWYHAGSCPSLTVYQYDLDRVLRPIFIGRPITLKRASEASMSRHGECGPPSYELE